MPGNVDDFMARFGGDKTLDDREAAQYHDRFVSTHPDDGAFDAQTYHQSATEYLGKLPEKEFQQSAQQAIAQAPPQERQSMLGGLLGSLGGGAGAGGGLAGIASMLGLGSTDPARMSDQDGAKVLNYARQQQPEALQKVVAEKPWFVKAMGNPVVLGALTMAAAKLLSNQRRG